MMNLKELDYLKSDPEIMELIRRINEVIERTGSVTIRLIHPNGETQTVTKTEKLVWDDGAAGED